VYFGSVKFFKHIILITVLLIIVGLVIATGWAILSNKDLKEQIALLKPLNINKIQGEAIDYQKLYPDMCAVLPTEYIDNANTVYLTFDDGPSDNTSIILDILKEQNIKATFFVTGKDSAASKAIMKRIVDEGHTIGIHTYSHKYNVIYSSVHDYLIDFDKIFRLIYEATGVKAEIARYPGGSINQFNSLIYTEISAEMTRRGFTYYDWNASGGDAAPNASKNTVLTNSINSIGTKNRVILLMHDSLNKSATVAALPDVIKSLKEKGYKFDRITNNVRPINFDYKE